MRVVSIKCVLASVFELLRRIWFLALFRFMSTRPGPRDGRREGGALAVDWRTICFRDIWNALVVVIGPTIPFDVVGRGRLGAGPSTDLEAVSELLESRDYQDSLVGPCVWQSYVQ